MRAVQLSACIKAMQGPAADALMGIIERALSRCNPIMLVEKIRPLRCKINEELLSGDKERIRQAVMRIDSKAAIIYLSLNAPSANGFMWVRAAAIRRLTTEYGTGDKFMLEQINVAAKKPNRADVHCIAETVVKILQIDELGDSGDADSVESAKRLVMQLPHSERKALWVLSVYGASVVVKMTARERLDEIEASK